MLPTYPSCFSVVVRMSLLSDQSVPSVAGDSSFFRLRVSRPLQPSRLAWPMRFLGTKTSAARCSSVSPAIARWIDLAMTSRLKPPLRRAPSTSSVAIPIARWRAVALHLAYSYYSIVNTGIAAGPVGEQSASIVHAVHQDREVRSSVTVSWHRVSYA